MPSVIFYLCVLFLWFAAAMIVLGAASNERVHRLLYHAVSIALFYQYVLTLSLAATLVALKAAHSERVHLFLYRAADSIQTSIPLLPIPHRQYTPDDFAAGSRIYQEVFYGSEDSFIWVGFIVAAAVAASTVPLLLRTARAGVPLRDQRRFILLWSAVLCAIGGAIPALISIFLRFYTLLVAGMEEIFLTEAGASRFSLRALSCLIVGVYPLVSLHVRGRLERTLIARGDSLAKCLRCGYPAGDFTLCPECGTLRGTHDEGAARWQAIRRWILIGYCGIPLILVAPFWLSWIEMGVDRLLN